MKNKLPMFTGLSITIIIILIILGINDYVISITDYKQYVYGSLIFILLDFYTLIFERKNEK